MKSISILLFLLYFASNSLAQLPLLMLDSISNEPVPFTNSWIIKGGAGPTSNELGEVDGSELKETDQILFSVIGYKLKHVSVSNPSSTVLPQPNNLLLNEATIASKTIDQPLVSGSYHKSADRRYSSGRGNIPWIVVRFFGGTDDVDQSVFLTEIEFSTDSDMKGAKMSLSIYSRNSIADPGEPINNEPIVFSVKKGFSSHKIDLSGYHIELPEEGFFVGFEWLII